MKVYQLIEKLLTFNQDAQVFFQKDPGATFKNIPLQNDDVRMVTSGGGNVKDREIYMAITKPIEIE